ncbi:hypothetical protein [Pandoraea iniqua]|uniref:hypothetical protein n=1 Tax=Pandoraea iniqua TaxID=2508288 RepID=UPI00123EDCA9|nr:hypothetical protein [Pandoraea iniqua]
MLQCYLSASEAIYKSEIDRKKNLEDKAGTYLAGLGISSSILVSLPAFLIEKFGGSLYQKLMVLIIFAIALGYLVLSAIYAVKVRTNAAHYVINSKSLESFGFLGSNFRRRWAAHLIELARLNEPSLTLKANWLYLAEKMFLRGVIISSCGGILLWVFAISLPKTPESHRDLKAAVNSANGINGVSLNSNLVSCTEITSNLGMKLRSDDKVVDDLKAELASSLKAESELREKLDAKLNTPQSRSSRSSLRTPPKHIRHDCGPGPESTSSAVTAGGDSS